MKVTIRHRFLKSTLFETDLPSEYDKKSAGVRLGKAAELAFLEYVDLRCADLSRVVLRYVDITGVKLTGANLYKSDLSETKLRGSELRDVDLNKSRLRGVDLRDSDLTSAQLTGSDLNGANLSGSCLNFAIFNNTSLGGAYFSGSSLKRTQFNGADLSKTSGIIPITVPPPCAYNWFAVLKDGKIWISAGCRWQTIEDREQQVRHKWSGVSLEVRLNAIAYIRSQAYSLGWKLEEKWNV